MNPQRVLLRCASLLALACVASAAKLEGYSAGGDTGLGVALDDGDLHEGEGHSGVGGGSVLPLVLVGSGVLPESAIVGATGGASGGAAGGVVGGESSDPTGGNDHEEDFDFDAGELSDGGIDEEYIPPSVVPEVAPVDVPAPGGEYIAPQN
ncbi:uncharacterized transmembrane protein DDB_G0289901 [Penaeus vannamei]|uniref:uncharacterized transmembrane protein DDB_G0289901 n=1 Tax=Penaeus vannamei TaxID=6689 RepID=UPI00387F9B63